MFRFGIRAMAIGSAALMALALPAMAQQPRGGRGGGAPAISHGGGAPAYRGGGAPAFRGGGVPAFRSGGAPRIAAPSFTRPAFRGAPRISQPSLARPAFRGGRTFARPRFPERRLTAGAPRITAGRAAIPRFGTRRALPGGTVLTKRGAPGVTGLRVARNIRTIRPFIPPSAQRLSRVGARTDMAAHAFRRADWRQYRHRYGWYAWAGPVFWPYAYHDFFDDIFWYYGPTVYYDDLFWDYGYGDIIYGGLFAPYGYDFYAYWTPSRAPRAGRGAARAPAPAPSWSQMCGDDTREIAGLPIERIQDAVQPNDVQRAALDELGNATVKAAQTVKAACPTEIAITPPGRLEAMEQRLQAMVQAVDIVHPPLETFYNLLSDEQKARFNAVTREQGEQRRGREQRSLTQTCGETPEVTEWPQAQIEQAVWPTEAQRASLVRLKDAAATAADMLKSTCPSELPATPSARLAAVSDRINAMLHAVRTVRAALNEFYGSLSDEQKAQFNTIGQARASR